MARNSDQRQNIIDLARQRNRRSTQQFIQKNLDRVEPVKRLGGRAIGDAIIVVAFTEVPEPDLVEIV